MLVREPIPGTVKTRLVPAFGAAGAAALYRAFVEDACARLAPCVPLALACAPLPATAAAAPSFVARLARRHGVPVMSQGEGDLGARMRGIATAALASMSGVVLLGSDVPTLPVARVIAALRALRSRGVRPPRGVRPRATPTRVVLGPSLDGGYHLLGLRAPVPDIFRRMPWSSDRVLARTLARLRRARITPTLLPAWYDVDTPADVDLLTRHLALLATLGEDRCPRTRRVLARLRRRHRDAAVRRATTRIAAS
ncbi:MAG: TIGR04282 family arsenosugar biosynthesis glycosyltransferase [Deltaproteobacteria bacterium]|nr:TIGR04282 family arsenosugar biosynthesis glycosyltransferase [Deltaproteobacteria bacterium]